jgi:hypothetical protein
MKQTFLILFFISTFICSSFAEDKHNTKFIKHFERWRVFEKNKTKECVIIAEPIYSNGFAGFRDIPHVMFTLLKGKKLTFSNYSGFIINKQQPIQVFVDDKRFLLKPYRDFFAFTYDSNDDVELINTLLKNSGNIQVRSVNKNLEVANDYYEFKGLDKAFEFVKNNSNCN